MDPTKLKLLIDQDTIAAQVQAVAAQITNDYAGKNLLVVMVMKGSLCFVPDLIRQINLPIDVEIVDCSSYIGCQAGQISLSSLASINAAGRDVLIIDDIFNSGYTLETVFNALQKQNPTTLKSCVLLYKDNVLKVTNYSPDYALFHINPAFVVGYGLDYRERYRGLPSIYILEAP